MVKLLNVMDVARNGQALADWFDAQQVDSIIIASDALAEDSLQSLQLRLLSPKGVGVAVKDMRGAAVLLGNVDAGLRHVAVITERLEDALFLLTQTSQIEMVFLTNISGADEGILRQLLEHCPDCRLGTPNSSEQILLRELL